MLVEMIALAAAAQAIPPNAHSPGKPSDQTQSNPIVVEGKKRDEDRLQCISSVPTGSLMPQRLCHTAAEWSEMRDRELMSLDRSRKQLEAEAHARQEARMSQH